MNKYMILNTFLALTLIIISYSPILMATDDNSHLESTYIHSVDTLEGGAPDTIIVASTETSSQTSDEWLPRISYEDPDSMFLIFPFYLWVFGLIGIFALVSYNTRTTYTKVISKNNDEEKCKRINGWLLLVSLGLLLTPLTALYILSGLVQAAIDESVISLISPFTYINSFDLTAILGFLFYIGIILPVLNILAFPLFYAYFMIYLFFTKKKRLPAFYIGGKIMYCCIVLLCAVLISLNDPSEMDIDLEELLIGAILFFLSSAIWIPYMLCSKRVKATFVR